MARRARYVRNFPEIDLHSSSEEVLGPRSQLSGIKTAHLGPKIYTQDLQAGGLISAGNSRHFLGRWRSAAHKCLGSHAAHGCARTLSSRRRRVSLAARNGSLVL